MASFSILRWDNWQLSHLHQVLCYLSSAISEGSTSNDYDTFMQQHFPQCARGRAGEQQQQRRSCGTLNKASRRRDATTSPNRVTDVSPESPESNPIFSP
mmetsp:Transcript_1606/g.3880  ORF Transcript_1606/g.3880 Transcript_1606/m.3880 type:complete len:99 (-) Transcript_1606:68-364(-)